MGCVALSLKLPGTVGEQQCLLFHLDNAKVRNILQFCNSLSLLCASIPTTLCIGFNQLYDLLGGNHRKDKMSHGLRSQRSHDVENELFRKK